MTTTSCSCGFSELDDESMTDHLHSVFGPDDRKGTDGQVHEEGEGLACWCGFAAVTPDDLDDHFLKVFTPGDCIGRDGRRHEVMGGGAGERDGVVLGRGLDLLPGGPPWR